MPLKVGMMTSWNTMCGIAEYSRYLVNALRRRDDVDVLVLGSKNYGNRRVEWDEDFVQPVFGVLPWNDVGDHSLDVDEIIAHNFDVLHIQYEVLLYHQGRLNDLLNRFKGLKAITYHDNCIPVDFPYQQFDLRYTHREDFGVGTGYILPMGVENRSPVIKTFGLGRSRADVIAEICQVHGWRFEKSFGELEWKPTEELYAWLRDSDAVVLYYEDVPSAGTSIAARVALSTRRPVFVNDVTWFKDLEHDPPRLIKTDNSSQALQAALMEEFPSDSYLERNSWDRIANDLVQDYIECLSRS